VDTNPSIHLKHSALLRVLLVLMTQVLLVVPMIQGCKFVQLVRHALLQQFAPFRPLVTPSQFAHVVSMRRKQLRITSKMVCQSL
jgi:hypothetical protein